MEVHQLGVSLSNECLSLVSDSWCWGSIHGMGYHTIDDSRNSDILLPGTTNLLDERGRLLSQSFMGEALSHVNMKIEKNRH